MQTSLWHSEVHPSWGEGRSWNWVVLRVEADPSGNRSEFRREGQEDDSILVDLNMEVSDSSYSRGAWSWWSLRRCWASSIWKKTGSIGRKWVACQDSVQDKVEKWEFCHPGVHAVHYRCSKPLPVHLGVEVHQVRGFLYRHPDSLVRSSKTDHSSSWKVRLLSAGTALPVAHRTAGSCWVLQEVREAAHQDLEMLSRWEPGSSTAERPNWSSNWIQRQTWTRPDR